jgi:hypothetical protein
VTARDQLGRFGVSITTPGAAVPSTEPAGTLSEDELLDILERQGWIEDPE